MKFWIDVLFRESARIVRRHPAAIALSLFVFVATLLFLMRMDPRSTEWIMANRTDTLRWVARRISFYGEFHLSTLLVCALLWLAGRLRRRAALQVAAIAAVLAASVAGLGANAARMLAGRPRPNSGIADGFYGFHIHHEYQSFISAHSATTIATGTTLAIAAPPIGVPILAANLFVPWSRFCMGQHHLSDVWGGGAVGLFAGVIFGAAARNVVRDAKKRAVTTAGSAPES